MFSFFFFYVSKLMFLINCYFILLDIYLYYLLENENYIDFSNLLLMKLWLFLICAVLLIGWGYGFQQYIFCIMCIFFLPIYLPENEKRKRYHMIEIGLLLILTYIILFYLCNYTKLVIGVEYSVNFMNFINVINSIITAAGIMSFSIFSTAINFDVRNKLTRRADYDELTKLYNRYAINQIIDNYINKKEKFYVAIADIDLFKQINDNYGHEVGDKVLEKVASIFVKSSKDIYQVGRWGGEEFLFIGSDKYEYEEFLKQLENIRKHISKTTFNISGNKIKFTISFGASKYKGNKKIENIIKEADDNLYEAKESGRNKIIG